MWFEGLTEVCLSDCGGGVEDPLASPKSHIGLPQESKQGVSLSNKDIVWTCNGNLRTDFFVSLIDCK